MKLGNIYKQLKMVVKHKAYVGGALIKTGHPLQAVLHDLTKFTPIELFEGIKYYQGGSSPIAECKKDIGYSNAWHNHKGKNRHHYEYWVDFREANMVPIKMPFKYAREMFCDYIGAGKAYAAATNIKYTIESGYDYWCNMSGRVFMHPETDKFIESQFKKH